MPGPASLIPAHTRKFVLALAEIKGFANIRALGTKLLPESVRPVALATLLLVLFPSASGRAAPAPLAWDA